MCGENSIPFSYIALDNGSPPRAWGESWGKAPGPRSAAVHPHVRGENAIVALLALFMDGSPPRAWGEYDDPPPLFVYQRFTPTCVGRISALPPIPIAILVHPHVRGENDARSTSELSCITVHPHVRGENPRLRLRRANGDGSPPRAWGEFTPNEFRQSSGRFTPTCVGRIVFAHFRWGGAAVHPHVRGENSLRNSLHSSEIGSPPRAWGECIGGLQAQGCGRFTPTCVGRMPISAQHPRTAQRFTPTCVGRMSRVFRKKIKNAVHPHVRGENVF